MRRFAVLLGLLALAGLVLAQGAYRLVINGKAYSTAPIVVKEKLYIPADALKDAGVGVRVDKGLVTLTVPKSTAEGGANQQDGQEGKLGEWLFNGIWRLRLAALKKRDDGTGYEATIELRNGSKFSGVALSGTGWNGLTLVLEDGNAIAAASDAVDLRDAALAQGASYTGTVVFETDSSSKPDKLILRLDPAGLAGTAMKYSVPNPTFRIRLGEGSAPPATK